MLQFCCQVPTERLRCDTLDAFLELIMVMCAALGVCAASGDLGLAYTVLHVPVFLQDQLEIWKADIDSAFRRLPIKPAHRNFAWVAWRVDEIRMAIAQHFSMPFGAIASVHFWDRIGQKLHSLPR